MAEVNSGLLRIAEAKRILIAAGLVKGRAQNVSGRLYHLLNRLEQFEKAEPGTHYLVTHPPQVERAS